MGPCPQQSGHLVNPRALGCRKQPDLAAPGLELGNRQGFGRFAACEFVGLGKNHQKLQPLLHPRPQQVQQNFVQFRQTQARIAHQHDAAQVFARDQVIGHHLLPAHFFLARDCGITVARQIGKNGIHHALFAQ